MPAKKKRLNVDYVYSFVVSWKARHQGNGPRYRHMIEGLGLSSSSHAYYYIQRMVSLGMITYRDKFIYLPKAKLVTGK